MFITSLRGLLDDLKNSPVNAKFIMPKNLNQDLLENAFSRIRGFGAFHQNPNAEEVGHRIKKLLLSWNFVDPKGAPVVMDKNEKGESDCISFIHARSKEKLPVEELSELTHERMGMIDCNVEPVPLLRDYFGSEEVCEEGGREHVAGFLAKKLAAKFPELSRKGSGEQRENFWVAAVSEQLTEPSLYWHAMFKKFDEFFDTMHGYNRVNRKIGVCKSLIDALRLHFPDVHADIIKFFVGTRTNIRVKHMNKLEEDGTFKRAEEME
ncbi:unnamed protein product [Orchesella dallaii]|uniref:Uncharacterized protein n=1 Tax=Orchesella dallaii TaxID=48710 RepID=A0ABP1PNX4_9HEXA